MKKTTTLKIDENVLYLAKREIPNISQFVENCLKTYLNITNDDDNVEEMQDALNTIKDAKLKIHLLSENQLNNKQVQNTNTKLQNETWIKIWRSYYNNNETDLTEAVKIFGKTEQELKNMMDTLITFLDKTEIVFCDNYNYAQTKYEEIK